MLHKTYKLAFWDVGGSKQRPVARATSTKGNWQQIPCLDLPRQKQEMARKRNPNIMMQGMVGANDKKWNEYL